LQRSAPSPRRSKTHHHVLPSSAATQIDDLCLRKPGCTNPAQQLVGDVGMKPKSTIFSHPSTALTEEKAAGGQIWAG